MANRFLYSIRCILCFKFKNLCFQFANTCFQIRNLCFQIENINSIECLAKSNPCQNKPYTKI